MLTISGQGATAAQAQAATNAVARSFISYVGSGQSAAGTIKAKLLASAASATGPSMAARLATAGGLGLGAGALIGAVVALALGRSDRRLRERDELADAIGAPVVASVAAGHPSDPAGWTKLLDEYEPGVVHAWSLRRALNQLGLVDLDLESPGGPGRLLDRGALAVGRPDRARGRPAAGRVRGRPGRPHHAAHRSPAGRARHRFAAGRVPRAAGPAVRPSATRACCGWP